MSRKSKAAEFENDTYAVEVIGRNVAITDALRDYAIEKVSKLERFSERIIDALVTMDVQKVGCRVDIILQATHIRIKSHAICEEMYAAIDKAVHKIATQLVRYKDRLHDYQTKDISSVDMKVAVLRSELDSDLDDINNEIEFESKERLIEKYRPHKVVNKKTIPLKTLSNGEALMKLDLSGDVFLIYRSEETQDIRVMYRRDDGDFGVIETKA